MSDTEPPWVFPYVTEPGSESTPDAPIRPAVAVSLVAPDGSESPKFLALVDSGSERTLAGPGLGRLARPSYAEPPREMTLHIGGAARPTVFGEVTLRLYEHVSSVDEPPLIEWSAEVGFFKRWEPPWAVVLGQRGFFDRFTVSMSRFSMALALEDRDEFDARYGIPPQDLGPGPRSRRSRH